MANCVSFNYKNFVFDLDGTLIDSEGDIVCSLQKALQGVSGADTVAGIQKHCLGLPLRDIVSAVSPGLTSVQMDDVCCRFREIYDSSAYPLTTLIPGVDVMLAKLTHHGVHVYLATNKPLVPTLRILDKFFLRDYFEDILCPNSLPGTKLTKTEMLAHLLEKRRLAKQTVLMVGDSEQDIAAAKNNGVHAAYFLHGYGDDIKAKALCPEIMFASMALLTANI